MKKKNKENREKCEFWYIEIINKERNIKIFLLKIETGSTNISELIINSNQNIDDLKNSRNLKLNVKNKSICY